MAVAVHGMSMKTLKCPVQSSMWLELFLVEVHVKSLVEFPPNGFQCPAVLKTKSFRYADTGEIVFADLGKDILKFILLGDLDAFGDQLAANALALEIVGDVVRNFGCDPVALLFAPRV